MKKKNIYPFLALFIRKPADDRAQAESMEESPEEASPGTKGN